MNWQDFKDQLIDNIKLRWGQFQESNLYLNLKEKYDDLSPSGQKGIQAGVAFLIFLILIMTPWAWMGSASENIAAFESKRALIRQLLQLKRDLGQAPQVNTGYPQSALRSEIQAATQQLGLTPEQIKGLDEIRVQEDPDSKLIPSQLDQLGVQLTVWKINLEQFVSLSHRLQNINPAAKLLGIEMRANGEDNHYYDVIYQVVMFMPPVAANPEAGGP